MSLFTIVSENAYGVLPEGPSSERLNETLMFFQAFHSSIETRLDFSMLHPAENFL